MAPSFEGSGVSVHRLSKRFGGVQALDDISFEIQPGEIVGLCGENGSGKSTLIKILTKVYTADSGTVAVDRVAVVHQDLGLVDSLPVRDNISVGVKYGTPTLLPIRFRREDDRTRAVLRDLDVQLDLDVLVSELTSSERAIVAIVRAIRSLQGQCDLLILDEPTAYLSANEAEIVLNLIRRVSATGTAVIFVSHRLHEIALVAERVMVVRDGKLVAEISAQEASPDAIVTAMLGRPLERFYPPRPSLTSDEVSLRVDHLRGGSVRDFSFEARRGEILGITGLTGMGQEDLAYLITGASPRESGTVSLSSGEVPAANPRGLLQQGIVLVPANRQRDGAWLEATASENISLPVLGNYFQAFFLRQRAEIRDATTLMAQYKTRPSQADLPVAAFSGGNQQKIVLSKWLRNKPTILLLDEPTQGVDAGARHDILETVMGMAAEGATVIMFSSDYEQLAQCCHRILVCRFGTLSATLPEGSSEFDIGVACQTAPDRQPT